MKHLGILVLLISSIFLAGCSAITTKSTTSKEVILSDSTTLENNLDAIISAEEIQINGREVTITKDNIDQKSVELEIEITNPQNIPDNSDKRIALMQSIATLVKSELKDQNEFDTYIVKFVTVSENSVIKKNNSIGHTFSSTELGQK